MKNDLIFILKFSGSKFLSADETQNNVFVFHMNIINNENKNKNKKNRKNTNYKKIIIILLDGYPIEPVVEIRNVLRIFAKSFER